MFAAIRHKLNFCGFKWEDFNRYIYPKTTGLLNHETKAHKKNSKHPSKEYIYTGFDESKAVQIYDRGRSFLVVSTDPFFYIMHRDLPQATEQFPDSFGKRDANLVVKALYDTHPVSVVDFSEFLRNETHAYVVEVKCGKIIDRLLRVDLFRIIETNHKNGDVDFTGGVLHVFKHFTYKGVPLSTYKENYEINPPSSIIRNIIDGFFFHDTKIEIDKKGKEKITSEIKLSEGHYLKFVFYNESVNGFYFIDSVGKRS